MIDAEVIGRLKAIVGAKGCLEAAEDMAPYMADWRGRFTGRTPLVLRPATTGEVSAVVAACSEAGVPMVPQGGNTGLVAGSIPHEGGDEVLISLSRLNRIRDLDADNDTVTAEAGCVLATLQAAAAERDKRLPLSFGAEGTAQLGGCLSTNAGGVLTLRYGNARDLVLGLEVVLPDGQVWDGLRRLRKDNTGYDLKHLFLGAEGTLGIITAAVLKLVPRPHQVETALIGVDTLESSLTLLGRLRAAAGDQLTACELIPRLGLDFALAHIPGITDPLSAPHPWYLLVELAGAAGDESLRERLELVLGQAFEDGLVQDATLAANQSQAQTFWLLREAIVEAQKYEGASLKNDVSVPVSAVPTFIQRAGAAVLARIPGVRLVPFGHIGDGNIHFNMNRPEGVEDAAFLARWDEMQALVNDIVLDLGGSISAEHGIGRIKRHELARARSPLEVELMRRIKHAFDPQGLMNPGKVLPEA